MNIIRIPVINQGPFNGPIISDTNISNYISETAESIPTDNLFYLKADDESMAPTIPMNSVILIHMQSTIEDGEIAAILVNSDSKIILKRAKYQKDTLNLLSDNPAFDPIILDNSAKILGKAIMLKVQL
ncbi:S24 family peptidase [Dellaglioa sp. BT-FLS60]